MKNKNRQRGQAALEFVFALLFIVIITAALFQALAFELDVFNQSMVARFEFFREAHQSPDTTPCRAFNKQFQGRKVSEFAPWGVPYQSIDRNMKYGPKKYFGERGSKYFDLLTVGGFGVHGVLEWTGILLIDHSEGSSDKLSGPAKALLSALALQLPFQGC